MTTTMFSDPNPGPCCWFWIALALEPRLAPVPPLFQEAVGGDADAVVRFFEPELWAKGWSLPLWLSFGTAREWEVTASWWRASRAKREELAQRRREELAQRDRFMTLDEIESGWENEQ
jgi:hypothetical protein